MTIIGAFFLRVESGFAGFIGKDFDAIALMLAEFRVVRPCCSVLARCLPKADRPWLGRGGTSCCASPTW